MGFALKCVNCFANYKKMMRAENTGLLMASCLSSIKITNIDRTLIQTAMEYYSAVKYNDITKFAGKWMKLEKEHPE